MKYSLCFALALLVASPVKAERSYSTLPELETYERGDVVVGTRQLRKLSEQRYKSEMIRQNELNRLANPHLQNQNSNMAIFPKFDMSASPASR